MDADFSKIKSIKQLSDEELHMRYEEVKKAQEEWKSIEAKTAHTFHSKLPDPTLYTRFCVARDRASNLSLELEEIKEERRSRGLG